MVGKTRAVETMGLSADFWAGKRIFLTGHTGFKGGWLIALLHHLGASVYGFALAPETRPNIFDLTGSGDRLAGHVLGDIRDAAALREALVASVPDIVIHMAAQALVGRGYTDPVETYSTNVMGTLHLFEAVRTFGSTPLVLNVTSDKCYENHEWHWPYRETEAMGGHDPYSSSKGCAELLTASYRESFFRDQGVRLASARAGNVIGGGDWSPSRLIPDALRAFDTDEVLVLRAPDGVRPWQHVLEPLGGYLCLIEHMASSDSFSEGWNFGPDERDTQPVGWVIEHLHRHLGIVVQSRAQSDGFHEAGFLKLDSSKARDRLGWSSRWSLETALQKTAEWHLAYRAGASMDIVTAEQIAAFLAPRT